ncbi:serine/threonine protein kinase, putative [Plasmodium malariae]|uniref:Serine/threonine protein kinase, putative n=1 Tax=Plasmodium malariae TaxID=5858 RepID=A0A1C3KYX5_PLAMA|nr:serine/threonine protein kinase, putative [Plasmodium malariae]
MKTECKDNSYENDSDDNRCTDDENIVYKQEDDVEVLDNRRNQKKKLEKGVKIDEMSSIVKSGEIKKKKAKENAKLIDQEESMKGIIKINDMEKNELTELEGGNTCSKNMNNILLDCTNNKNFDKFEQIEKTQIDVKQQEQLLCKENEIFENQDEDKSNKVNCKVVNKKTFCAFS